MYTTNGIMFQCSEGWTFDLMDNKCQDESLPNVLHLLDIGHFHTQIRIIIEKIENDSAQRGEGRGL